VRRGFEERLCKEDLEDVLPPLMDVERGFLYPFEFGAGDDDDENCVEVVGDAPCECCGEFALGMSTQTNDYARECLDLHKFLSAESISDSCEARPPYKLGHENENG